MSMSNSVAYKFVNREHVKDVNVVLCINRRIVT